MFEFPWLSYSEKFDGAFCQFCFFFSPREVGKGSHSNAKALVTQAFNRWKDAKKTFRCHQTLDYHKNAFISAEHFINVFDKKTVDISVQLNSAKRVEIEKNRKLLSSIVETIIFVGRQEIACRGHRDAGPITVESPVHNDGNFRALTFSNGFRR